MKAEILNLLKKQTGYLSGQEICDQFGVSRTAVWKVINQLKEEGYQIEAVSRRGYRLLSCPEVLSEQEIMNGLNTRWAGKKIFYYDEITSTNDKAKELAAETSSHGYLVVSDYQSKGKGRRGRSWESPKGTSIYMTLVLKPRMSPDCISSVTLVAALAVKQAIARQLSIDCKIKWPNDLVVNGKKICGILTEMSSQPGFIEHVVIGIGINANTTEFPEEIRQTASSLMLETGEHVKRSKLVSEFLNCFEPLYDEFEQTGSLHFMKEEYDDHLVNRNEKVRVLEPGNEWEGMAIGINDSGGLLVKDEKGRIHEVLSGEVSVRGVYGYV